METGKRRDPAPLPTPAPVVSDTEVQRERAKAAAALRARRGRGATLLTGRGLTGTAGDAIAPVAAGALGGSPYGE